MGSRPVLLFILFTFVVSYLVGVLLAIAGGGGAGEVDAGEAERRFRRFPDGLEFLREKE